jgi:hypothetical protein
MYDLVWVGKNYSKTDLIKDLKNLELEIECLEKNVGELESNYAVY